MDPQDEVSWPTTLWCYACDGDQEGTCWTYNGSPFAEFECHTCGEVRQA